MENLYVFAIGGSGERVFKSLMMVLTTGMSVGAKRIIPVFVDNDVDADAFRQCCKLINYYNGKPGSNGGKMGANTLYSEENIDSSKWGSFFHVQVNDPVVLNKSGNAIGNLNKVIGYVKGNSKHHKAIEEEMNLLFTNDDLNMPLNVGFVGNPNIGSVVLNALSLQTSEFNSIIKEVSSKDGVIVVGSLFGGTGAAGLPLVINKFRNLDATRKPILGGIAVLPYFLTDGDPKNNVGIDPKIWDVKPETFITKTRAALMYYDEYMKLGYDFLYYVGDSSNMDVYEHNIGASAQKNPYHIVELMSALSIIDFSYGANQSKIVYKEPIFGFDQQNNTSNVSGICVPDLARSLVKFQIMKKIFTSTKKDDGMLKWAIDTKKPFVRDIRFTEVMRKSVVGDDSSYAYAWGISELFKEFDKWMNDLKSDKAKHPFLLFNEGADVDSDNITKHFYSDNQSGIAKLVEEHYGFLNLSTRTVAKKANILAEMQSAYSRRYRNLNSNDVTENKALPMLLNIISDALDNVLNENVAL